MNNNPNVTKLKHFKEIADTKQYTTVTNSSFKGTHAKYIYAMLTEDDYNYNEAILLWFDKAQQQGYYTSLHVPSIKDIAHIKLDSTTNSLSFNGVVYDSDKLHVLDIEQMLTYAYKEGYKLNKGDF